MALCCCASRAAVTSCSSMGLAAAPSALLPGRPMENALRSARRPARLAWCPCRRRCFTSEAQDDRVEKIRYMQKKETTMTGEHLSKDQFFERLGVIGDEMIAAYGKDFAMGAFVLAARFIAEGK